MDEVRAELGKVLAQKHLAAKKMADESNRHEAIDANLQAAVDAGRDDLPRQVSPNKWTSEARLPVWKTPLPIVPHKKKKRLEGFIAALQAKKTRDAAAVARLARAAQQNAGAGKAAGGNDLNRIARDAEKKRQRFRPSDGSSERGTQQHRCGAELAKLERTGRLAATTVLPNDWRR